MDQDRIVYIVVDRVGAPYRVLLYQPGIRFSLGTNTKVLSLQHSWCRRGYTHGYGSGVGYTGAWLLLIDNVAEDLEPCLY